MKFDAEFLFTVNQLFVAAFYLRVCVLTLRTLDKSQVGVERGGTLV